jgi:hypothetical protein
MQNHGGVTFSCEKIEKATEDFIFVEISRHGFLKRVEQSIHQ